MGEPGGKHNHGFPPEVVHTPRRKPLPLGGPSTAGGWLDQKPGARFVLPLCQWETPPAIPPSITAGCEDCTFKRFSACWFSNVQLVDTGSCTSSLPNYLHPTGFTLILGDRLIA
jgi:hypothetical protein